MLDLSLLSGWIPIRIDWRGQGPEVDWCYLGSRTFREPFFDHTIRNHLRDPFNASSRKRTGIQDLVEIALRRPHVPLAGLVFHMSRCGSTLVSRSLALNPKHLVLSEPPPIDELLALKQFGIPDDVRILWLQALVSALGQPRSGQEEALFIKLDSWHIHELPLFAQAFPGVPWIFVYRDPLEVLVSHHRLRGMQMAPGQLPPARLQLELADIQLPLDLDRFCAKVIGNFCRSAAQFLPRYQGRAINYRELPAGLIHTIFPHFSIAISNDDIEVLQLELAYHAKNPGQIFTPDAHLKQSSASTQQIALVDQYARHWYEAVEHIQVQMGA